MKDRPMACLSTETALPPDIPTYNHGMGVVTEETIRSGPDSKWSMHITTECRVRRS